MIPKQPGVTGTVPLPPVMSAEEAAHAVSDLPPAGFARDEVLAQRKDALEAAINLQPLEKINPKALLPDSELQHDIVASDMLSVSNAKPERVYAWVFTGTGGTMIWKKKAEGWVVVSGSDPECSEWKHEDSTRRIGDTILMWIPREKFDALETRRRHVRELQIDGITAEARELARKGRGALILHENGEAKFGRSGKTLGEVMESRAPMAKVAMQGVDKMLRDGSVPGMPRPGVAR